MVKKAKVPAFIDARAMAERRKTLQGSYAFCRLSRLAALLYGPLTDADDIAFHLDFFIDEAGHPAIRGSVQAVLPLLCQRCLQPMSFSLQRDIALRIVECREEIRRLPAGVEPLEITGVSGLRVQDLIEDELLLSMPYAPRHENEHCSSPHAGG